MRGPIVVAVSIALAGSIALAPSAVVADPFDRGMARSHVMVGGRHVAPPRFTHRPFPHRPFPHHRAFHPFLPFAAAASPVVIYAPVLPGPAAYYDAPSYVDPPAVYYSPWGGAVPGAPPAPTTPTVVQYPTGRYELRGDGITTPYTWVWIPNPPPGPPPAAPPAGAPAASDSAPPPQPSTLYRWIDEQGVLHLTDNWETVPQRYRGPAGRAQPS